MVFNEEAASVRPPFPFDRIRREGVDIFGDRYFSFNLEEDKIRRHEVEEDEGNDSGVGKCYLYLYNPICIYLSCMNVHIYIVRKYLSLCM